MNIKETFKFLFTSDAARKKEEEMLLEKKRTKLRRIEIKTRKLSNQVFAGSYHSAFKGRGISFSEVREYQYGDDVRAIDWNVTARNNSPYIKVFEEERELTVMLLIDVSKSTYFGTQTLYKSDIIASISAILSFSAIKNNDKVGALFFSDHVEQFIPPRKGKSHIMRIVNDILDYKPQSNKTDIAKALQHFGNIVRKKSIAFLISDFVSPPFQNELNIVSRKHDFFGIHVYDIREKEFIPDTLIQINDLETKSYNWVKTGGKKDLIQFKIEFEKKINSLKNSFAKAGAQFESIETGSKGMDEKQIEKVYVNALQKMFLKREVKR